MKIQIIGGAYLETCSVPRYEDFFGSGGRAAAALSKTYAEVVLHTCVNKDYRRRLESLARAFDFEVNITEASRSYQFDYYHPASDPRQYPVADEKIEFLKVRGDHVLVFGMVEARAAVEARFVVYDPQNPGSPKLFPTPHCNVGKYAVVANASEAIGLARRLEPDKFSGYSVDINEVGQCLLGAGAECVVIKRGAFGLTVYSKSGSTDLPAYRTQRVWPIGSGDVFSAMFAAQYFRSEHAVESAKLASRAVAYYCNGRELPIPNIDALEGMDFEEIDRGLTKSHGKKSVYLAAPFFTLAQRWVLEEVYRILRSAGLKVFSPLHEVGPGEPKTVAPLDIEGLEQCDLLFAILDGYDPGTMFEIGYAISRKKPVVAYIEEPSRPGITMVEGMDCTIETDLTTAVYKAIWA